jgi:tRNA threonylcarbamoyladenosine biosynthesis protein TsaE
LPASPRFAKREGMTGFSLDFPLKDAAATTRFGAALGARLKPGDVILLVGDLGAGKTTFARGMIAALAGVEDAPSPTYTLVQTYETSDGTPLLHADLYRIEDEDELDELGIEDAFEDSIVLIEWPDRMGRRVPEGALTLKLRLAPEGRMAHISGGAEWKDRLDGFDPRG